MRRRLNQGGIVCLFWLAGFTGMLQAQPGLNRVPQKWEFSLFGGFGFLSDKSLTTPAEGGLDSRGVGLENDSGYVLGVRVTENLSRRLGAEVEYAVADQSIRFQNLLPSVPLPDLDQKVHKLAYSLVYYPADRFGLFRPFLSVGAGASYFQLEGDSQAAALQEGVVLRDRWKFAFSYGGGLKYVLNRTWGLRFDVRDQITGVPDYGLPSVSPVTDGVIGAALRPDGITHSWQFTVGFSYFWDGYGR